ncbi:hypothetical protein ABZ307_30050 [Streptomyces griseorubiginosus]|uniref:hypothetical protein n=1 Tax=Streptomyces griseorubiginosus TaxID=67304 RepID=UPI0033A6B0C8
MTVTHRLWTGVALTPLGRLGYEERFLLPAPALVPTARARPWHAVVGTGALAGLSFGYGAYLVVLAHKPR